MHIPSPFIPITRRTIFCNMQCDKTSFNIALAHKTYNMLSALASGSEESASVQNTLARGQQRKNLVNDEPISAQSCRNPWSSCSEIKRYTKGLYQRSWKSFLVFWSLVSQCLNDVRSINIPETRTRRIELRRYMFTRSDIYVFKNKKILPRTKG